MTETAGCCKSKTVDLAQQNGSIAIVQVYARHCILPQAAIYDSQAHILSVPVHETAGHLSFANPLKEKTSRFNVMYKMRCNPAQHQQIAY